MTQLGFFRETPPLRFLGDMARSRTDAKERGGSDPGVKSYRAVVTHERFRCGHRPLLCARPRATSGEVGASRMPAGTARAHRVRPIEAPTSFRGRVHGPPCRRYTQNSKTAGLEVVQTGLTAPPPSAAGAHVLGIAPFHEAGRGPRRSAPRRRQRQKATDTMKLRSRRRREYLGHAVAAGSILAAERLVQARSGRPGDCAVVLCGGPLAARCAAPGRRCASSCAVRIAGEGR
jgi:hypothetical protein